MTAPAFLHRYCLDHDPHRALCGLPLIGVEEIEEKDVAVERMPVCAVCDDLHRVACVDACLGARSEAAS